MGADLRVVEAREDQPQRGAAELSAFQAAGQRQHAPALRAIEPQQERGYRAGPQLVASGVHAQAPHDVPALHGSWRSRAGRCRSMR